jgi:hypothetical protein
MNHPSLSEYLNGLKPTWSGVLAVILCLFIIPLFADLFTVVVSFRKGDSASLGILLAGSYFKAIPFYLLYLTVYFIILNILNYLFKKLNFETFYFGS